jgi:hypothetical protein
MVTALFMSVGIATLAMTVLVLWGLRGAASAAGQNKTASSVAGGR